VSKQANKRIRINDLLTNLIEPNAGAG